MIKRYLIDQSLSEDEIETTDPLHDDAAMCNYSDVKPLIDKIEELTAALIKTNPKFCPEAAGYETDYKYKKEHCIGVDVKCNVCWRIAITKGVKI
jgi:hypothetical protein